VWPMDADAVIKRFNNHPQQQDEDLELREHGDGDSWLQLRKTSDAAVADKAKVEAQRLSQSLHSRTEKARAAEVAAERALKKLQRVAATAGKSRDRANTNKRKASRSSAKDPTNRRRVVGAASRIDAAPKAPPAPTQNTRTRSIRPPKKYSE
jgi:hypothetical protein